jgi:hypothetical protein
MWINHNWKTVGELVAKIMIELAKKRDRQLGGKPNA